MVGTRGKGEVGTGTKHLGFRCVKYDPVLDWEKKNVARGHEQQHFVSTSELAPGKYTLGM